MTEKLEVVQEGYTEADLALAKSLMNAGRSASYEAGALDIAHHRLSAPLAVERQGLTIARDMIVAEIEAASGDSDWEGQAQTALAAIDAALNGAPLAVEREKVLTVALRACEASLTEAVRDHPAWARAVDAEALSSARLALTSAGVAAEPAFSETGGIGQAGAATSLGQGGR